MATLAGSRKVLVKTPLSSDGKEDFTVEFLSDWTVRRLKEEISHILPKKTIPDDQKLIFSGSILSDESHLKDCFRNVTPGSYPVVHLVCKLTPPTVANNGAASTSHQSDGLHRRHGQPPAAAPVTAFPASPDAYTTNPWITSSLPRTTFEQNHMAQYYQNYQAYLNQYMYSQLVMNPMMTQHPINLPHINPHNIVPGQHYQLINQPAQFNLPNHQVPIPNGPVAPAADPQVIMNAQGGAAIADGEGEQRDAFDRIYMAVRFLALLCAIYFSSSSSRFFSAFTMLSVFLLFNTLRDFRRWRERQLARNAAVAPIVQPAAPAAVPPHNNGGNEGEEAPPPAADEAPPAVPAEQEPGLVMTVLNLVVGFFTTLVPDLQAVVA